MPQLGEIRRNRHAQKQVWAACNICAKERWVVIYKGEPTNKLCKRCSSRLNPPKMEKNPSWKGGRSIDSGGYVSIKLAETHPMRSMANSYGYIKEHRLVMARHLKRLLEREELVHHKNADKTDNRIENLTITRREDHPLRYGNAYKDGYEKGYSDGYAAKFELVV